jgi:hypothetical protein
MLSRCAFDGLPFVPQESILSSREATYRRVRLPQYHEARAYPEFPSLQGRGLGEGEMACFSGA